MMFLDENEVIYFQKYPWKLSFVKNTPFSKPNLKMILSIEHHNTISVHSIAL